MDPAHGEVVRPHLLRRGRGRVRAGRRRRRGHVRVSALDSEPAGDVRRRRGLERGRRDAHRVVELSGPFTLHSVAASALGLRARGCGSSRHRTRAAASASRRLSTCTSSCWGWRRRSSASRSAGPRTGSSTSPPARPPRLAARRCSRVLLERRAPRTPLRRARGRRRVRPGARAGDALPDARVAGRRLSGSEHRRPKPRRPHEPLSHRPQPRLRWPAALPRPGTDDGRRRPPPRARPAELRRRNLVEPDAFPYRTPTGALYDSGDYEACLDQALDSLDMTSGVRNSVLREKTGGWSASGSPASSSRRSRTWATSRWPRRPRRGPRPCRNRATSRGDGGRLAAGRSDGARSNDPGGRATRPCARKSSPTRSELHPTTCRS